MDPRKLAAEINTMKPGEQRKLDRHELENLKGDLHHTGWEIVRENVIGSAHDDIWSFETDHMTKDITISRYAE